MNTAHEIRCKLSVRLWYCDDNPNRVGMGDGLYECLQIDTMLPFPPFVGMYLDLGEPIEDVLDSHECESEIQVERVVVERKSGDIEVWIDTLQFATREGLIEAMKAFAADGWSKHQFKPKAMR